jgi:hypothetical protein
MIARRGPLRRPGGGRHGGRRDHRWSLSGPTRRTRRPTAHGRHAAPQRSPSQHSRRRRAVTQSRWPRAAGLTVCPGHPVNPACQGRSAVGNVGVLYTFARTFCCGHCRGRPLGQAASARGEHVMGPTRGLEPAHLSFCFQCVGSILTGFCRNHGAKLAVGRCASTCACMDLAAPCGSLAVVGLCQDSKMSWVRHRQSVRSALQVRAESGCTSGVRH